MRDFANANKRKHPRIPERITIKVLLTTKNRRTFLMQNDIKSGKLSRFSRKMIKIFTFFLKKICRFKILPYLCIIKIKRWIHLRARIHASHAWHRGSNPLSTTRGAENQRLCYFIAIFTSISTIFTIFVYPYQLIEYEKKYYFRSKAGEFRRNWAFCNRQNRHNKLGRIPTQTQMRVCNRLHLGKTTDQIWSRGASRYWTLYPNARRGIWR